MLGMLSRSMGGSSDDNLNYRCQSQHIPQGKNISKCPRDQTCDYFGKECCCFCLSLKTLIKAKLKTFR